MKGQRALVCRTCGHGWRVPDRMVDGTQCVCGNCQEVLVWTGSSMSWRDEPRPFVARFGMSPAVLWGSLIGSTWWLPMLLGGWVWSGGANAWAFVLLSVPYVGVVYWLLLRQRRSAMAARGGLVLLGLGGYSCYLWALIELCLVHGGSLPYTHGGEEQAPWLAVGGAVSLASGRLVLWRHGRRVE